MSVRAEKAVALMRSGFACSQAVFAVFCENFGLEENTALRIACGLGGGVKSGEVCGVVSGAALVIGLQYGHVEASDKAGKALCSEKVREFVRAFRAKKGGIVCRDILGIDISSPEGLAQARAANLFETVCNGLVAAAVETLEEAGYGA